MSATAEAPVGTPEADTQTETAPAKTAPKKAKKAKAADRPASTEAKIHPSIESIPTGEVVRMALKSLVFDPALQQRCDHNNQDAVERYTAIEKETPDGDPMPYIRAVRERHEKGETFYVFDGFTRGAARKAAGKKDILVEIIDGTYQDALYFSLRSNSTHGLTRTPRDLRKAFDTVVKNPELLSRVTAQSANVGGMNRALALTCGISKGTVAQILLERNLYIDKKTGQIASKPKPKDTPATPEEPGSTTTTPETDSSPTTQKPAEQTFSPTQYGSNRAGVDILDNLKELSSLGRRAAVIIGVLATHKEHGEEFRHMLEDLGFPLAPAFMENSKKEDFQAPLEALEHWVPARQMHTLAAAMICHVGKDKAKADSYISAFQKSVK